jgi:hypothetical protein
MRKQGTFKTGHKKLGGRKKGTPNRINSNLIERIVQAAEQVGADGKGKDGVDGYLQMLADQKTGYFVGLLRQAVQRQVPTAEPQNQVVYATEQDFRQALLDRGVHPTLLPPPPREFNEKPPTHLNPPKPPSGGEWVLRRADETADVEKQQEHPIENESETEVWERAGEEDMREGNYGTPSNPAPGYKFEYSPDYACYFVFRRKSKRAGK